MYDTKSIDYNHHIYLPNPDTLKSMDDALFWGGHAASDIANCKALISRLEEYQRKVYERVQTLETAPYHHRVTLHRERRFRESKVFYHLIVEKVYDIEGIKPTEIQRTNYPGTERREAIKAFEAYKKSHPGIEAVLDIEKGRWEK